MEGELAGTVFGRSVAEDGAVGVLEYRTCEKHSNYRQDSETEDCRQYFSSVGHLLQ